MSSAVVDPCVYHRLHVDYGRYPNLNVGGPDVVFMEKEGRNVAKE